jgi:carbonic anhydrase/acetyltransferase-like protein (isoleucine patch superfamily)
MKLIIFSIFSACLFLSNAQAQNVINMSNVSASSGEINVNGKVYKCSGSLSMDNGDVYCNDKLISGKGLGASQGGPCGGPSKKHPNGGGTVGNNAKVSAKAYIAGSATVCGNVNIGDDTSVLDGASINGTVEIAAGVKIARNASINGNGNLGSGTVIEEGAKVNGSIDIKNSTVKRNASLAGNIKLDGVTIEGSVACSGNGTIKAAPNSSVGVK